MTSVKMTLTCRSVTEVLEQLDPRWVLRTMTDHLKKEGGPQDQLIAEAMDKCIEEIGFIDKHYAMPIGA